MAVRKQSTQAAPATAAAEAGAQKAPARHSADTARKPDEEQRKYQFVVGVTLATLEEQVNQLTGEQRDLTLKQVLFATGTGFIAVLERG